MEISNQRLYIIVFLTGAIVMILELVGSRILAPTLGTSIYVWTSLIGIILGAMSLGYYLGGRLADKDPNTRTFSNLILLSGIFVFIIIIIKKPILDLSVVLGLRNAAIFSAISLFAVPGVLLGAVSPYSVRLAMKKIETSGNTVGNLYAVSTFGSIAGTFSAGFYFIPNFGSINILYGLAIALFLISLLANSRKSRAVLTLLFMFIFLGSSVLASAFEGRNYLVDEDSAYNHIRVYDTKDFEKKVVRIMAVENFFDSGMYLSSDDLVFGYTKFFRLGDFFNKDIRKAAIFGGAAYSIPKDFVLRHKEASIDVVEIDPKTTEIAKEFFNLNTEDPRINIFHQDARVFLNERSIKAGDKYDVIYNDAFGSTCTVPFQLTTRESIEEVYELLNDDGIYVMNVISAISGEKSDFFKSEYKTIKERFKNVYVFPVTFYAEVNSGENQNIIVIATKKEFDIYKMLKDNPEGEMSEMLSHYWKYDIATDGAIVLTDDFAPVDYFTSKICNTVNQS
ncbi:MAG: fused MFS/spermidine synthase [Minisyncoccia bacterium]